MEEKVIMAGFGGQGIMAIGKLLAYAGMLEGKNVTWMPSYGPEMRGGTANCAVVVSEDEIGSPLISKDGTAAIVMNLPSMIKFEKELVPGGKLIINKSLIDVEPTRKDLDVYYIPANELALELGNGKVANMVMLGSYLELTKTVEIESVLKAFVKVFGEDKADLIPLNKEALLKGAQAAKK
ncbi:MAG TPA: 2-oxoacid:acceptor oxidoreductase family protein [Sedimentibacter sp.]|jgi:2-oxoglutarate ferredoxin oxidoreductase subunit gamma|nr:2-oxoacid:acceptor oxidoreductase family protein [Sedimentibacter sp.]HHZ00161.1 2-oxoacid:ferredoxin oxidoreductase subunit gamma [Tissierellia bacterium]HOK49125.1 2-oxoacid:acceptor oxidoreductase family protein [Sedimentibacter sp.]HOW23074.1 2-oxoacid:acceptor oxidoreductase family protein [Sedimentibacter sp.]HRC80470.1 2-oxoacid:acceptor oxidoreductase family protein [Sedimentibacter sp.]